MASCRLCHFATPLDDVALRLPHGVICLRCYCRETASTTLPDKRYRRHLEAVLAAFSVFV